MAEFTRSLSAQGAAAAVIAAARDAGFPRGAMVADPELAEMEKELFLQILERLRAKEELSTDEISSLFSFVTARAAEAVTNRFNRKREKFEMLGLFDGKIPFYADERLTGYFKTISLPGDCARGYLDWFDGGASAECDPLLALSEALKWTFRIAATVACEELEGS